jgi:hypothetical protein
VIPLYDLEKEGRFKAGYQRGIEFATARLAAGAQDIRDMIVDAWSASATGMVFGENGAPAEELMHNLGFYVLLFLGFCLILFVAFHPEFRTIRVDGELIVTGNKDLHGRGL